MAYASSDQQPVLGRKREDLSEVSYKLIMSFLYYFAIDTSHLLIVELNPHPSVASFILDHLSYVV